MKRVCLGKIVGAHGVKGLVKVLPFGDDPLLIETLGPAYTSETGPGTLSIAMKNSAGNKYWLAAVDGVTERNGAEALRGTELYVPRESLPKIENENSFYFSDLVGIKALNDAGKEIGEIIAVQNFGAGDLLEIKPPMGESYYLPFNKEFVKNVDLEGRTMLADVKGLDGIA